MSNELLSSLDGRCQKISECIRRMGMIFNPQNVHHSPMLRNFNRLTNLLSVLTDDWLEMAKRIKINVLKESNNKQNSEAHLPLLNIETEIIQDYMRLKKNLNQMISETFDDSMTVANLLKISSNQQMFDEIYNVDDPSEIHENASTSMKTQISDTNKTNNSDDAFGSNEMVDPQNTENVGDSEIVDDEMNENAEIYVQDITTETNLEDSLNPQDEFQSKRKSTSDSEIEPPKKRSSIDAQGVVYPDTENSSNHESQTEFLSEVEYLSEVEILTDAESQIPCHDHQIYDELTVNDFEGFEPLNDEVTSNEINEIENVVDNDSDDKKSLTDSPRPKNTDHDMHCQNPLYQTQCQLCTKTYVFLPKHYMNQHPDREVLIARPSPDMADRLRSKIDTIKVNTKNEMIAFCYFCADEKVLTKIGWAEHILGHTGELMYTCSGCNTEFASKNQHNNEECIENPINIYTTNSSDGSLVGFMCTECNYFQIKRERIFKHLENEHGFIKIEENHHYGKYTLLPINMHLEAKKTHDSNSISQGKLRKSVSFTLPNNQEEEEEEEENDVPKDKETSNGENKPEFRANIDIEMHCKNEKYQSACVLCESNERFMVPHYTQKHSDREVFIARLMPQMADCLRTQMEIFTVVKSKGSDKKIYGLCYFCGVHHTWKIRSWMMHFLTYTGENILTCEGCEREFRFKIDHDAVNCSSKPVKIFTANSVDGSIAGFMCNHCNYFQFKKERMIKHLGNEHGFINPADNTHFEMFVLIPAVANLAEVQGTKKSKSSKRNTTTYSSICYRENTNPEIHCQNSLYNSECLLCGKHNEFITAHYKKNHSNHENLVARPSPLMADRLRLQTDTFGLNDVGKFNGFCYFCEYNQIKTKADWGYHLLNHTGEKTFVCNGCNTEMQQKMEHNQEICDQKPKNIFLANSTDGSIAGFMCKDCNYFQFKHERIIRHLKNEHRFDSDLDEHYAKFTLVPNLFGLK